MHDNFVTALQNFIKMTGDGDIARRLLDVINGRIMSHIVLTILALLMKKDLKLFEKLLPIDFFMGDELSHKEFEDFILEQKFSAVQSYGDDYVECDATKFDSLDDTSAELDSVLLEAENVEFAFDNDAPNEESLAEIDMIDNEDFADPSKLLEKISAVLSESQVQNS